MIALNLNDENRILSACTVLSNGTYSGMPIVDSLPSGNLPDYLYIDGEFIYDPIPVIEPEYVETPSKLDILDSRVTYLAMMTDNLYWEE